MKIRLHPTPEQEILFWKSAGTARWAYNFYLSEKERVYHDYLSNGMSG
ncbi:MAG: helix-turn-helix domain-containing protein, partial [Synergistaceae bacterium]|nr:helix-turn-helix domain-containing protein [Synergistaceae bacterium]